MVAPEAELRFIQLILTQLFNAAKKADLLETKLANKKGF